MNNGLQKFNNIQTNTLWNIPSQCQQHI